MATDTAHEAWDEVWQGETEHTEWGRAERQVLTALTDARLAGLSDALDLGCGVGRHTFPMAQLGFRTSAFDASDTGLKVVEQRAAEEGLSVTVHQGRMNALPFADGAFDFVLAWNVIYHGDPAIVEATIAEMTRILRPGGRLYVTMLSKRRADYGRGSEIAPNTFVQPDGPGDKSHPHFFCNAAELVALFPGFEVMSLIDNEGDAPGEWHFELIAERLAA